MFYRVIIVIGILFGAVVGSAQHSVVQSLSLTDGPYRAQLTVAGLTSNVACTLPTTGGTIMTSGTVWALGGQSLLSGGGTLGSTDAASVQVITAGTPRLHINGAAGADQGWVGVGTTTPSSPLHVASTIGPTTSGFHSGLNVATTLDAASTPPAGAEIGGTVSILQIPAGTNVLSAANTIFGAGGAVFSSYASTSPPVNLVGTVGNVTITPSAPGMTALPLISALFGTIDVQNDATVTDANAVLANTSVGTNSTVATTVGLKVLQTSVGTGSTVGTNTAVYIANQDGITGVATSRALHYDGPGSSDVVITANGRVGVGTDAPDVSVDIDGGLVVRPPAVIDIEAAGSATVTVGNRSFLIIGNPNMGVADVFPNNAPITLSNGVRDGHVLIIRSNGAQNIQFQDAAASLELGAANRNLGTNDTLTLIWYAGVWYETSFVNN